MADLAIDMGKFGHRSGPIFAISAIGEILYCYIPDHDYVHDLISQTK